MIIWLLFFFLLIHSVASRFRGAPCRGSCRGCLVLSGLTGEPGLACTCRKP
ncbi:unnamed protein product [Nyctereutes procyonoides]|uniref:(raccoon dog) hypothetical protein n=1 Tax=Nyctereutes procyonoides TaxID=34880 RepID=A0A811ZPQ0_NYCPR|nr:unnamed protein product [Nyctereutes procyonoides]